MWVEINIEWPRGLLSRSFSAANPECTWRPLDRFSIFLPPQPRYSSCRFPLQSTVPINRKDPNKPSLARKQRLARLQESSTSIHNSIYYLPYYDPQWPFNISRRGENARFRLCCVYTNFVTEDRIIRKQERLWKVIISVALFCVHAKLTIVISPLWTIESLNLFLHSSNNEFFFFFNTWNNWKIRLTSFLGIFHIAICSIMN